MQLKIYQIDINKDKDMNAIFRSYGRLCSAQNTENPVIDSSLYNMAYEGDVNAKDLEDIFYIFSVEYPDDFKGRSLSVSDVCEVHNLNGVEDGFYFVDSVGYQKIDFNPSGETEKNTIKVLCCEPGQQAKVIEIGKDLESLQKIVDGYIETYYPFEDDVCIVCNDEGKFNGSKPCRAIFCDGELTDIIFGTFIICDCSGEDFGSLSDEQLNKYKDLFLSAETYTNNDGKIGVMKY